MSKITMFVAAALAGCAVAAPATAQTTGSDNRQAAVDARESRQDTRIIDGIAGGGINANEATRLSNQQARIDNSQARLAADGNFSRRDYARTHARQDRASANIARARGNRR